MKNTHVYQWDDPRDVLGNILWCHQARYHHGIIVSDVKRADPAGIMSIVGNQMFVGIL